MKYFHKIAQNILTLTSLNMQMGSDEFLQSHVLARQRVAATVY